MTTTLEQTLRQCTQGSDTSLFSFPQVIAKLMEVGVERYHADLQRSEKTYYMPDGKSYTESCESLLMQPATTFSAEGVEAAVRAIQAKHINYQEFCERIGAAGCVGYLVSLEGRRAVYYGRNAQVYVEPFPEATEVRSN